MLDRRRVRTHSLAAISPIGKPGLARPGLVVVLRKTIKVDVCTRSDVQFESPPQVCSDVDHC